MSRYAIGVDFGTESGRAVLVHVADGTQLATAVYSYRNGVIDERLPLPDRDVPLPPDWALQDPEDYLRVFQSTVHGVLKLTLRDRGYDWEFLPVVEGAFSDRGSGRCHDRP